MKNTNKKTCRALTYLRRMAIVFCTVIGSYGIITAPESDKNLLEQDLMQKQEALQNENLTASVQAKEINRKNINNSKNKNKEIKPKAKAKNKVKPKIISVIGDSVFLGASQSFKKIQKNAVIDAKISRQVYHALDVAKELKKKNKLGDIVIISLGINGNFNQATGQELIDFIGKKKTIYWINAYGKNAPWQDEVNKTIKNLAEKNKNLHIIQWDKEGKKHSDWFYQDGTHLNEKGQKGFARFIKNSIDTKRE